MSSFTLYSCGMPFVTHMTSQAICTGCQMFAAFVEMPPFRQAFLVVLTQYSV